MKYRHTVMIFIETYTVPVQKRDALGIRLSKWPDTGIRPNMHKRPEAFRVLGNANMPLFIKVNKYRYEFVGKIYW